MKDYEWYSKRWGQAAKDDSELFLLLTVGVFQTGLSWKAAAGKKAAFLRNFSNMDIKKVAAYFPEEIGSILADPEMIRNSRKIRATIQNARAIITLYQEYPSFHDYLWHFVDQKPIIEEYSPDTLIPNTHPQATKIAKDMKKRGFSFVGPVVTCMFLKSIGLIQDRIIQ